MKPVAVILEGTVEAGTPEVEVAEIYENSEEIGTALHALGYRVEVVSLTLDVEKARRALEKHKPSVAFNLVDSIEGMGNLISIAPLLLEHLKIPFTGDGSMTTAITSHKLVTKQLLRAGKLPTANWMTDNEIENGTAKLPAPYLLKSLTEHASFGIFPDSVAKTRAALRAILQDRRKRFWGEWYAEEFIDGREFNIGLLATGKGAMVLPPAEMTFTADFPKNAPRMVDYTAKWYKDTPHYKGTVRSFEFGKKDAALLKELRRITLACWSVFNICGYARVDFRVDKKGRPCVLEVNSNPFLTAGEGFGKAASHAGFSFTETIRAIVADAYRRAARPMPQLSRAA